MAEIWVVEPGLVELVVTGLTGNELIPLPEEPGTYELKSFQQHLGTDPAVGAFYRTHYWWSRVENKTNGLVPKRWLYTPKANGILGRVVLALLRRLLCLEDLPPIYMADVGMQRKT